MLSASGTTLGETQAPSVSAPSVREQSGTAYEGLSTQAAESTLGEVVPSLVELSAGGPPSLTQGQKALGYPNDYTMSIELPNGGAEPGNTGGTARRALVESATPLALETEEGRHAPLDLSLRESQDGFQPTFGLSPVRLPRRIGEGAELTDTKVSLTPVTEQGLALEGGGKIDNAGVFYGDTEDATANAQDLSMFAKPTTAGLELFSVLFSERSPEALYFKVGMPQGAALEQESTNEIRLQADGQTLAVVGAPNARDAEGTPVPISMSVVSQDIIKISVPRQPAQFGYPLVVDPELIDGTFFPYLNPAWKAHWSPGGSFEVSEFPENVEMRSTGVIHTNEMVEYQYETQGTSKIYQFEAETLERDLYTETETFLEAYAPNKVQENWGLLANNTETTRFPATICAIKTTKCEASQGADKNLVNWVKRVVKEGGGGFEDWLYNARVWISQTESPSVHFNTTSANIQINEPNGIKVERENVLYPGSKGWIGPYSDTAFEMIAKDPGIGVSFAVADGNTWSREVFLMATEKDCQGDQCPENYEGKFTYLTDTPGFHTPMPSGEYSIQGRAEDPLALTGETHATIRVDATPPENIKIANLPAGDQIGEGVYKLKAEATDGKPGTPSSGVQSLELGIDGAEATEPRGSCLPGPCTASAEWTVNGGQLSVGPHVFTVLATDNAGNKAHKNFVVYVHHASPVSVGPGSLDPQSGNYSLGANDVSMGPGLSVSRTYSSRNLTAGLEGPLGPQWAMSLGGDESLTELADGSMMLTASTGVQTVFERNSKGEFESPQGDANVTLSPEENGQKVPVAYYLRDVAAGTSTEFARPEGFLQATPTYYGQAGWQGTGSGQLNMPAGVATDAKGDIWVADTQNDRVAEFNPQGEYLTGFGYEGRGPGTFSKPHGIAVDAKGNVWVADTGNNRIEEFKENGEYVREAGTEGVAALKEPQGIAVDPSGNVWVVDTGDNRVVEFNEKGEYIREAVKAVGSTTLSEPLGVAIDKSGDAWVTDANNHRVVEFSPTGAGLKEFGAKGTTNGKFEMPAGIAIDSEGNVWVTDSTSDDVQEFNSKDEYLTKFGSKGSNGGQLSKPYFLAIDARGALAVADSGNSRVERWAHAAWFPKSSVGATATSKVSYAYQTVLVEGGTTTRPVKVVAPHLSELSCEPTIKVGCRALIFKYADKTTATGENESEWNEYDGRLKEVLFAAYNPSTKTVQELPVAQYAYDTKGRLRAEWDTRIAPALKTVYGYDEQGHVTAVSPAGQEPWLMHYGTVPTDASAGRLLSVIRPAATTELGSRLAPRNTGLPTLSTSTPAVGSKISVSSNGSWSNGPLAYSYQWEDCNSAGGECVAIPGAVNESYYPVTSDEKHKLVAQVVAVNAGGSTAVLSAATGLVGSGTPYSPAPEPPNPGTSAVTTIEYAVPLSGGGLPNLTAAEVEKGWGQKDDPVEGMAIFRPDTPMGWPAKEYKSATIDYFDAEGHTVNILNPNGGISTTEYNATNDVTRTLSPDNRATALKEGSKSAEVAANLDSRSVYNSEGDELLETTGPQHAVKLSNGEEVEARHHVKYYYDEGAPEGEEYHLLTRTVDAALVEGKEEEPRTRRTYYSGQKDLGWKLRKPTSIVTNPEGLDLVNTTVYNEATGAVEETRRPSGTTESVYPPLYMSSLGTTEGNGSKQFNHPEDTAIDSAGDLWVDDKGNHRLQKFSTSGELLGTYGSENKEEGELKNTWGIAINQSTNELFVSDFSNDRIDVFSETGKFLRSFGSPGVGNGEFNGPLGLTIDAQGDVWVADSGNNRVEEFSSSGMYISQFGSYGTGNGNLSTPIAIAVSEGELYVVDYGNDRVEEFTRAGIYLNKFGDEGSGEAQFKGPEGIAVNQMSGDLYVSDAGNERVEEFSPAGKFLTEFGTYGLEVGRFHGPTGLTVGPTGEIYVADQYNARVDEWLPPEPDGARLNYSAQFGGKGKGEGQFEAPVDDAIDGSGNIWIVDHYDDRVEKFSAKGKFLAAYGSTGSGNGQFSDPTGIDINKSSGDVYVMDCGNHRVEELNSEGAFVRVFGSAGSEPGQLSCGWGIKIDPSGNVWVADTENNRVQEFSATGSFVASYGSAGTGDGQFKHPEDIAFSGGNMYVTDNGNNRVQELSMTGVYIRQFGAEGSGYGQLRGPEGIATDAAGNLYVVDDGNGRVEEFNPSGGFLASFGESGSGEGQFEGPVGIAINSANDMYVTNWGSDQVEMWTPANQAAHDTKTVYYSTTANSQYPACGEHVEWEGMPCKTLPGAQPEGSSAPPIPTTTITAYNMWGEPEASEETFGGAKRTKRTSYDEAGRVLTTEETATADSALPKVTDTYSETTGQLVEQSTKVGEETQTITSKYDKLGRLTSYVDASKNTTTYEYEPSGDGRLTTVTDEKGYQSYAYDPTSGELTKLLDSGAKTFTASYDVEGNMTNETYPNGMTATYTRNTAGEAVGLEYVKTTHCTEKCTWYTETTVASIHGEMLSRASTLADETYAYDAAGRLVQTTETPAGKGCVTRIYRYDEDSNRTSLTTREPGTEGKCASEGGTTERHTYDAGDRLNDAGTTYDEFGNITKLPASDAGGYELTSEYYVDGQVRKQTQDGQTNTYSVDPDGRISKTVAEGTIKLTTINHYDGPGEALAWKEEGEKTGKYTRLIPGINGALGATEASGSQAALQLSDLQGDIVATAAITETETKLLTTYNSTEFGVQVNGPPPTKYSWLGAGTVSSELSSGIVVMGTVSYVPQLGKPLQTVAVTPPGAGAGAAAGEPYISQVSPWSIAASNAAGERDTERVVEEETAHREAEEKACAVASECVEPEKGRVVDPAILLTTRQAEVLAAALRKGPKEVEALAVSGVIKNFTMEMAELIVQIGQKYMDGMAYGLESCVQTIDSAVKAEARCRLYIDDDELGEGGEKITLDWGVETCWGEEHDLAGKRFWTFPYCHT